MADGSDPDRLAAVGQLVDDPIGAHPQRVQAPELAPKRIASKRVPLEQPERILNSVDQRPAELKQVAAGPPGEDKSRQRLAGGRPAVGQLTAKLGKGERLSTLDLAKPRLQGSEGIRIGEDLGGLLQSLVLVDRNKSGSGGSIAGDQDVVAPIADIVEQAAEVAAQLSNGNGLCHKASVPDCVHLL